MNKKLDSKKTENKQCDIHVVVKPSCSHELDKRYWFKNESKCLDCGQYIK